jgi:iron complex transport system substrate-binding protein
MDHATNRTLVRHRRRGSSPAPARALALAVAALLAMAGAAPATWASAAAFPLTVVDDEGTSLTLEAVPQRVISLSPANTEIVFALGAGDRLVGGTDFDDHPAEAAALPDVATFTGVIMERLVALEPDLVLAAGNNFTPAADIARMRELDIPVLVVYAETVADVVADVELIGTAIGEAEAAEALAGDMRTRIAQVEVAVAGLEDRPRTFYEIGSEPEIYGPAPGSFVADMVELAGGTPVTTDDPAVFSIPLERLVVEDPEVIVLGDAIYGVCPDVVAARPGWTGMAAVRDGAIRPVDDIIVTRPGPRLPDGLAALARAIHPDIDLPGFEPGPAICPAPTA